MAVSVTAGTMLHHTRTPLKVWFLAAYTDVCVPVYAV